jgi:WD40 repeat protein
LGTINKVFSRHGGNDLYLLTNTGRPESSLSIWNTNKNRMLRKYTDEIRSAEALSKGIIAVGLGGGVIHLWNLYDGGLSKKILITPNKTPILQLLKVEPSTLVARERSFITIWDLKARDGEAKVTKLPLPAKNYGIIWGTCPMVKLSKKYIAASNYTEIFIVNLEEAGSLTSLPSLKGHTASVSALTVHDNETIISGSMDETIRMWNWQTMTCLKVIDYNDYTNSLLKVGKNSYFVCGGNGQMNLLNVDKKVVEKEISNKTWCSEIVRISNDMVLFKSKEHILFWEL